MVIVIGKIISKPGHHAQILELSLAHCARSRREAGCRAHNVNQDCENSDHFTFLEYWDDIAALKAHFALEASQRFVKDLTPHLNAPPDMQIFKADVLPMTA